MTIAYINTTHDSISYFLRNHTAIYEILYYNKKIDYSFLFNSVDLFIILYYILFKDFYCIINLKHYEK